jgi:hypothetical protein
MDRATVNAQLKEVVERLAVIEAEREVLTTLRSGLEGWLSFNPPQPRAVEPSPLRSIASRSRRIKSVQRGRPIGSVSLRGVVPGIVKDAGGVPIHASEIMRRARAMGAESGAKEPESVIDLMLYMARKNRHLPIERTSKRTWRWTEVEPRSVSTPARPAE